MVLVINIIGFISNVLIVAVFLLIYWHGGRIEIGNANKGFHLEITYDSIKRFFKK